MEEERMKISKSRIAVLVLLVATIIYGFTFALRTHHYYSRLAEQKAELEEAFGKVYVSTKHFFVTSEGQQFFMGGIVFVVAWLVLLNLRDRRAEKKTLLSRLTALTRKNKIKRFKKGKVYAYTIPLGTKIDD